MPRGVPDGRPWIDQRRPDGRLWIDRRRPVSEGLKVVKLTSLQASELGLLREAQHLVGIRPNEIQLHNGVGGGRRQHAPHGVVLRDGLGFACQTDVPPVVHICCLHGQNAMMSYSSIVEPMAGRCTTWQADASHGRRVSCKNRSP